MHFVFFSSVEGKIYDNSDPAPASKRSFKAMILSWKNFWNLISRNTKFVRWHENNASLTEETMVHIDVQPFSSACFGLTLVRYKMRTI